MTHKHINKLASTLNAAEYKQSFFFFLHLTLYNTTTITKDSKTSQKGGKI